MLVTLVVPLVSLLSLDVYAQGPAAPGGGVLGGERPAERLLEPELERKPEKPELVLPPVAPAPRRPDRIAPGIRVFVKGFEISGNTVFTTAELDAITAPYVGREITSEELEEVRHKLTLQYVSEGYINSGAVIPDQDVKDGRIRIEIVEGILKKIDVQGTETLNPEFIRERLELGAGPPLNVRQLGERLQIVVQDPVVGRINADLQPGDRPGEANLVATVQEARPHEISLVFDNQVVPSLGDFRGLLSGRLYNLSGWGDILNIEVEGAEGLGDFFGVYSRPFTSRGTTFQVRGEVERSRVVGEFEPLDIRTDFYTVGFGISHPVYQTPRDRLVLSIGLDRRHSETSIGGVDFSFPPLDPALNGVTDTAPLRFSQEWLTRTRNQIFAFRSTFNFGIDWLGATSDVATGPDGEYFAWLGQLQWARVLDDRGSQILFRAAGQYTPDQLLPMEQFSVGGARSVRGYEENQLVRDSGFSASIEYRYPVLRKQGRPTLQLAAFFDAGGAWFNDQPNPSPEIISSPGVGVLWDPMPGIHAELYYGYALEDIEFQGDNLQADGIHFQFVVNLFDL